MSRVLQISLSIAALVAAFSVAFACWRLSVALDSWGSGGAQTFAGLNTTLDALNRPCNTGKPCGTLANINKTLNGIDSTVVHVDLVARHEQQQLGTIDGYAADLDRNLQSVAASLSGAANAGRDTAQAATGTLKQAQVDLGTLNGTIAGLQPLEASLTGTANASTATINTFNGRLSDPHIDSLMDSFDSMSKSGVGIVSDGKTLSDYVTKQVTTPKTFMQKVEGYSGDVFDISAYLARHYR